MTAPSTNSTGESPQLRARARISLRRANLVVALGLLLVLALAFAGVGLGWKATRSQSHAEAQQERAEQAEQRTESELQRTYLAEARGQRLGHTLTRRGATLDIIRRAAALHPSAELRDEAVAALALPGLEPASSIAISPGVRRLDFSPDLLTSMEGLQDGTIILRRATDGSEIKTLRPAEGGISAEQGAALTSEFSRDGRRLAARYDGGALAVWDLDSGRTLFVQGGDKKRHPASCARFSSDGRFVVGPLLTPAECQGVIEVSTGRIIATFPGIGSYRHVAVRPDSTLFAVNSESGVAVMDWQTQQEVASFDFPAGCRSLNWSDDGQQLAIAGNLLEVHVWNYAAHTCKVLPGHQGDVNTAVFAPRGERLATSALDGLTRIWDLPQQRLLGVLQGRAIQLGSDGRISMETPQKRLEVRRITPSPFYRRCPGAAGYTTDIRALDISSDGNWAASTVPLEGVRLWNLTTAGASAWIAYPDIGTLCFDPAGARLFIGGSTGVSLHAWSAGPAGFVPGPALPVGVFQGDRTNLLAVSCNGRRMVRGDLAAGRLWTADPDSGENPVQIKGAHNSVAISSGSARGTGTVAFSPDGRWLVCGLSGAEGVMAYESASGAVAAQLSPSEGNVQFSPDGRWLVIARSRHCRVLRAGTWETVWEMNDLPVSAAATAAFSPDGTLLATPDSATSIAILETSAGRRLASLEAPDAVPVTVLRWTANGERLVCGTRSQEVEVWEIPALARELKALSLGWEQPFAAPPPPALVPAHSYPFQWLALGVLTTGCGAVTIALLSLRRHRRLIENISLGEALAAQRERELDSAREINLLKSTFVSMVSHEFRTPLGIIQSSAQILERYLEKLSPDQRREQIHSITGNVRRMSALIEEVLLLGRVEGGHLRYDPALMEVDGFCRRLVDEMHSATNRICPIQFDSGALPPALADEALLRHILGNLLSNAVKYSPRGQPVHLTLQREQEVALFTIRDEGLGIPAADLPRLFTAFHRGGNVSGISGTGLGLTIVKTCVDLHGGTVSCDSQEGRGTTFTVRLPLWKSAPSPSTPDSARL